MLRLIITFARFFTLWCFSFIIALLSFFMYYCWCYLMFDLQLFDKLRKERPHELSKIVPVAGDVTEHELGISEADQNTLAKNVSIVFHSAATVKFDEALKLSVTINMLGTKRLVELCHRMQRLEVQHRKRHYFSVLKNEFNFP